MMRAKRALLGCVGVGLLGVAAACSAEGSATTGPDDGREYDGQDAGRGNAPSADGAENGPAAKGIVLVHAASFPSFRLCFENALDQRPQPESDIMPESNLVGVETGSFVRFPPMDAPGATYVIDEKRLRGLDLTCRQLFATLLDEGVDYDTLLEPLSKPLGATSVDVVAITGCASEARLDRLGVAPTTCGMGWVGKTGNLRAQVISLETHHTGVLGQSLPVQLYQLSAAVDAFEGDGGNLGVAFGDLGGGGVDQDVDVAGLFATSKQTTLTFDHASEAVYGTHGFRITVGPTGKESVVEQSLASVQDLSSSKEVPSTYYGAASNYALLLLGDPAIAADAGVGTQRTRMHLLAVPVVDPSTVDAGADASADGGS